MMSETDCLEWLAGISQDLSSTVGLGIGDDAAVLNCSPGRQLTISQDLLVEDVHFRGDRIHPRILGRKALLVNLSDLAAMGSTPVACLLSLALPTNSHRSYLKELVGGLLFESRRFTCPLIGGDLSRSSRTTVAVTVVGSVPRGKSLLRSGASAGDSIMVVGSLGLARLGLELSEKLPSKNGLQLDSETNIQLLAGDDFTKACLMAQLLPTPQLKPAAWLRRKQLASAAIDVSDGLALDLLRLARASGLKAVVDTRKLFLPENTYSGKISREAILEGGEDYALLFTASASQMTRLREDYPRDWEPCRVIGTMESGGPGIWLKTGQSLASHDPRGFDHFR